MPWRRCRREMEVAGTQVGEKNGGSSAGGIIVYRDAEIDDVGRARIDRDVVVNRTLSCRKPSLCTNPGTPRADDSVVVDFRSCAAEPDDALLAGIPTDIIVY